MKRSSDDSIEQILAQAELLKFEGNYQDSLTLLEKALNIDPQHITVLEEIADNELSMGRYDRAGLAATQALALDSKSYTAHYILGFIASHFSRWEESIRELKIANTLEQNHPEILRCLGWSLFCSGQTVEGMVTLERALNLEDSHPLILCDLGVVYLKLKKFTKSKALLRRALDLDPKNERASECLEMVQRIEKAAANDTEE